MKIRINQRGAVRCDSRAMLPLPVVSAWGQLRDFHRFAAQDYFHAGIRIDGGIPRAGAAILMTHRFLMFTVQRRGRILRWRENEGYAFSDLSMRGYRHGFPHVLSFRLEAIGDDRCALHIRVSGRWTAQVPRWMAWVWLRWVSGHVARSVENQMLMFAAIRRPRMRGTAPERAG